MKKIISLILTAALLFTVICVPLTVFAETAECPVLSGFDLTQSDSSLWQVGGWGNDKLVGGTLTVTNGWGYYGGKSVSSQSFSFTFNTSEDTASMIVYFRNSVSKEEILSGNSSTAKSGNPFTFTYSASTGNVFFSEYTGTTSTQLRNAADTAYAGGTKQGLNDGEDHTVTIVTVETDITELKLFIDGVYLFSSYYHGGVKAEGYIGFTNYTQKAINITELHIDGVDQDPALLGQETAYSTFGFESELVEKFPNGESDTVYAETTAAAAYSGEKGLHIVKQAGSSCWFYVALSDADTTPLISGKTYRASMYIKTNPDAPASGQATFNFYSAASAGTTAFSSLNRAESISNWGISNGYSDYLDTAKDENNGGWTKLMISSEFTVNEGYPYLVLVMWAETTAAFDWYIDDIKFCEITQVSVSDTDMTGGSFTARKADNIYSIGTSGAIEVTEGAYAYGDTVELKAAPGEGYCLEGWYINGEKQTSEAETYRFKLTANSEITARFEQGYNLIHTDEENWSLGGSAELSDVLNIPSDSSAVFETLLLTEHTVKLRYIAEPSGGTVKINLLNKDLSHGYSVNLSDSSVILAKENEQIAEAKLTDGGELYLRLIQENENIRITVKDETQSLIDYTDTAVTIKGYFLNFITDSYSSAIFTHIGIEGLIKSEFTAIESCKEKIDSTYRIDIGSSFLDDLNTEYSALAGELSEMLPNTEKLGLANSVYNEFVDSNLDLNGLVKVWRYSSIEQTDGGTLNFTFETDETLNEQVEQAGFSRSANGAAILPTAFLEGKALYAASDNVQTTEFADNGSDISHYSVSLSGWDTRARRNTQLSVRGYSIYQKDGIELLVYSETKKTSVYETAVQQYNIIALQNLETSVFNGETALLYLSGDDDNQVIDISLTDIKENVKTIGRTSYSETALIADRALAGFAISGSFTGDVSLTVDVKLNGVSCMYAYSVVDGDYTNARRITMTESGSYVIASFPQSEEHTIELFKATEGGLSKLDIKSLQMTGRLYEAPAAKDLMIEFLGDSITSGWGVYTYAQVENDGSDTSLISDSFLTYASLTSQKMYADASVISRSGIKTEELFESQYPYIHDRSKENWGHTPHPDIIVVNLGQNDVTNYANNQEGFTTIVEKKITELRAIHPDAAIVWVNGMMSTTMMPAIKQAVENTADPLVFSYCLPTNTEGQGSHPSVTGQAKAAEALTEFLQQTVLPVIVQ